MSYLHQSLTIYINKKRQLKREKLYNVVPPLSFKMQKVGKGVAFLVKYSYKDMSQKKNNNYTYSTAIIMIIIGAIWLVIGLDNQLLFYYPVGLVVVGVGMIIHLLIKDGKKNAKSQ